METTGVSGLEFRVYGRYWGNMENGNYSLITRYTYIYIYIGGNVGIMEQKMETTI